MTDESPAHRVTWSIVPADLTDNVTIDGFDTFTQRTYRLVIPVHMLPALADALIGALERNRDVIARYDTRRIA